MKKLVIVAFLLLSSYKMTAQSITIDTVNHSKATCSKVWLNFPIQTITLKWSNVADTVWLERQLKGADSTKWVKVIVMDQFGTPDSIIIRNGDISTYFIKWLSVDNMRMGFRTGSDKKLAFQVR